MIRHTATIYDNYSRCKSILWYLMRLFASLLRFVRWIFVVEVIVAVVCWSIWVSEFIFCMWWWHTNVSLSFALPVLLYGRFEVRVCRFSGSSKQSLAYYGFGFAALCSVLVVVVVADVMGVFATAPQTHDSIFITFSVARSGRIALKLALFKFTYSP